MQEEYKRIGRQFCKGFCSWRCNEHFHILGYCFCNIMNILGNDMSLCASWSFLVGLIKIFIVVLIYRHNLGLIGVIKVLLPFRHKLNYFLFCWTFEIVFIICAKFLIKSKFSTTRFWVVEFLGFELQTF